MFECGKTSRGRLPTVFAQMITRCCGRGSGSSFDFVSLSGWRMFACFDWQLFGLTWSFRQGNAFRS